ncbi:hypothetical protein AB6A40_003813 [Gnathostoma spinigerum]|uniref:Mothers against decapentaplegic homolog n=1 Tax=Gnathostoma spinigerum TaxID=75299 RepID=A0ABD6EID7_9BILA
MESSLRQPTNAQQSIDAKYTFTPSMINRETVIHPSFGMDIMTSLCQSIPHITSVASHHISAQSAGPPLCQFEGSGVLDHSLYNSQQLRIGTDLLQSRSLPHYPPPSCHLPSASTISTNYYDYPQIAAPSVAPQTANQAVYDNQPANMPQVMPMMSGSIYHSSSAPVVPSSSHHVTTSANDPCAQIAHVLQCYQQGGEDAEFVRKAIESLVKKLKDRRSELENLITAVTSAGKQPTSCVTIQRSLDGRLQVAGRKGVPHVVYARIWRWPNVNKNELQKLPICNISADNQDVICINPYHYERIVSSGIGNIDMSTLRLDSLGPCSSSANMSAATILNTDRSISAPRMTIDRKLINASIQQSSCYTNTADQMVSNISAGREPLTESWLVQSCGTVQSPATNLYPSQQGPFGIPDCCNLMRSSVHFNLSAVQLPQTSVPDHWCSISYYELDTQIGETFKVRKDQSEVVVDGGVNPDGTKNGRLCLGAIPNVHRCEASERARLHIGKGVRLSTTRDGSVYLECLSHKSLFVRSYYIDFELNLPYGQNVHKFSSGSPSKKIFDLRWAYAEMEQQSKSAHIAVLAQAAAVAGYASPTSLSPSLIEHAGTGVDDLRRMCCTIAISFVKGWGPGYNRSSIKETPCWIELQLYRPLQLLDQLLKKNDTGFYGHD